MGPVPVPVWDLYVTCMGPVPVPVWDLYMGPVPVPVWDHLISSVRVGQLGSCHDVSAVNRLSICCCGWCLTTTPMTERLSDILIIC